MLRDSLAAELDELRDFLSDQFPRWWLPDRIDVVESIPRTSTGKFQKSTLREQYADAYGGAAI